MTTTSEGSASARSIVLAGSKTKRRFWQTSVAATLLLSCSPLALHAETSNAELAKEIAELKAQIKDLKGSVSATRAEAHKAIKVASHSGGSYVLPPPTPSIPVGATPVFVTADHKFQFGSLTITPGGFIEAAGIYRSKSTQSDISSNFNGVPFANNIPGHTNETHFSARDTRLALLVEAPISPTSLVSGYVEGDFNAAAPTANESQTNSYQPRIRHLYGTLDNSEFGLHVLAGQTWSLVTLNSKGITPRNEVTPNVIDSSQVVGSLYARQPGIRITKDFDKKLWVSLAAEESQTTGCPGVVNTNTAASNSVTLGSNSQQLLTGGLAAQCGAVGTGGSFVSAGSGGQVYSYNHAPDVIGKVAYEAHIADRDVHLEALGLYTDLYDAVGTNYAANATTGATASATSQISTKDRAGYGVGGGIIVPVIPKLVDLQLNGVYGRGIERYGPGQLPDATFNPDGSLRGVQGYIALAGLTVHATPALDLYSYAGVEGESRAFTTATNAFSGAATTVGVGAPSTNNTGCFTVGSANCNGSTKRLFEITGGFWDKVYKGSFGEVRAGASYSYVNRDIYGPAAAVAGGGAVAVGPAVNKNYSTGESIVFTSLRYYPFVPPAPVPAVVAKY